MIFVKLGEHDIDEVPTIIELNDGKDATVYEHEKDTHKCDYSFKTVNDYYKWCSENVKGFGKPLR